MYASYTSSKLNSQLIKDFRSVIHGKQIRVSVTQQQQAEQQQAQQQQSAELSQLLEALARQKEQEEANKKSLWGKRTEGEDDSKPHDPLSDNGQNTALQKILTSCGVQQISQNAYQEIVQHARYFTSGVMPENLPAGFFIDKINGVLKFDTSVKERIQEQVAAGQHNNHDNPPLYLMGDQEAQQHKQLLTEAQIKKFSRAQQFPPKKKTWWDTLVIQHVKATGDTNLDEIYKAFEAFSEDMQTFWKKVYKESFQFPPEFLLTEQTNIYVTLQRLSHIVRHSADPKGQLTELGAIPGGRLDLAAIYTGGKQSDSKPEDHYLCFFPREFAKTSSEATKLQDEYKKIFMQELYTHRATTFIMPQYKVAKTFYHFLNNLRKDSLKILDEALREIGEALKKDPTKKGDQDKINVLEWWQKNLVTYHTLIFKYSARLLQAGIPQSQITKWSEELITISKGWTKELLKTPTQYKLQELQTKLAAAQKALDVVYKHYYQYQIQEVAKQKSEPAEQLRALSALKIDVQHIKVTAENSKDGDFIKKCAKQIAQGNLLLQIQSAVFNCLLASKIEQEDILSVYKKVARSGIVEIVEKFKLTIPSDTDDKKTKAIMETYSEAINLLGEVLANIDFTESAISKEQLSQVLNNIQGKCKFLLVERDSKLSATTAYNIVKDFDPVSSTAYEAIKKIVLTTIPDIRIRTSAIESKQALAEIPDDMEGMLLKVAISSSMRTLGLEVDPKAGIQAAFFQLQKWVTYCSSDKGAIELSQNIMKILPSDRLHALARLGLPLALKTLTKTIVSYLKQELAKVNKKDTEYLLAISSNKCN